MQARVSRSGSAESQEVVGRVMDVVNTTREEVIRLDTERIPSRPTHPAETVAHPNSLSSSLASVGRKITTALAHATQPETVLTEIAAILGEAYGVQACIISVQPESYLKPLSVWFAKSQPTKSQQAEILANYDLIKSATLENSGLFIADLTLSDIDYASIDYASKVLPVRAVMSISAKLQGQAIGVISVMRTQAYRWSDLEVETFEQFADQIAIAISQLSLQRKVAKQSQAQALLREVSIAIQNSVEVPKIQAMALEGLAHTLEIDQAFVLRTKFWDPRQNMRAKAERVPKARVMIDSEWSRDPIVLEDHTETPLSQSFWVTDCSVCQVAYLSTDKSFAFGNSDEFPNKLEIAPIFDAEKMPALLLVPLESKNRLLGFIALQQKEPRIWQPEEIELVELLTAQISSAIIQTETLRQVESLVEERTAQLQQSLELQAKLYEITRKQIEKLREMNQRMDEFLSTLSHELRTPLTSMMLAIRMLRQANLTPDRRQQYLNILEQQCTQETNLINDLLALQELETKQVAFQLQQVDVKQLISDLSNSFNDRWASKGLTLELELPQRSPIFNTDLNSFNRILLELLTNAGKYADPNTVVHVQVMPQPGQLVKFAISNIGSAISEEELPHIFDKFRRCQGMTQNAVPGTGLGLALVKSLVQHLNGTIEATSIELNGTQSYETCFTMTLPLNLEIAGV